LQPESARSRIVALDKARVWHPYTEMSGYRDGPDPLVIVRAEGSRLFDADGRGYLDGNASWWSSTLGHAHPRLLAALRRQSETLGHTALAGITHGPAAALGEALCRVAPAGLEHVFYSDDGSTAVEARPSSPSTGRRTVGRAGAVRCAEDAFHGETSAPPIGGVEVSKPFEGRCSVQLRRACPREPGACRARSRRSTHPRRAGTIAACGGRARAARRRRHAPLRSGLLEPPASCAIATTCS
jgi:adenosylmethionine-8-amino-7-oxononanoate aminotransferase